ncbi:hypothetical protein QCA50_015120 [Cerrena zonata]|uniref:DUF6534 domain-containing protein n=1 Tax=Cerrena zonata TaxID=2478898 RepID=A0AAW0FJ91_9APHY
MDSTAAAAAVAAQMPTISEILTGLIFGVGMGLVLYGVSMAQAYVYMLNCENDPTWMKWLVAVVSILETAHTAFLFRELYTYSVTAIENPLTLGVIDWSIGTTLLSSNVIACLVEGFYVRRQWILSKSWLLTLGTSFLLFARVAVHFTVSIETFFYPTWTAFHQKPFLNVLVQTTLALAAAVDAVVAISMVYFLRREKGTITGAKGIITWMMMYAVHSGLILMAASLVVVLTFVTMKDSLTFAGFIAIIGKLYSNSLLGTLNARQVFRSKNNSEPAVKISTVGSNAYELSGFSQRSIPPTGVRIDITQETSSLSDKAGRHFNP